MSKKTWTTIEVNDGQVEVSPNHDESWEVSSKYVDSICLYINNKFSETSSGIGLSVEEACQLVKALNFAIAAVEQWKTFNRKDRFDV